jgi:hypothetical protein
MLDLNGFVKALLKKGFKTAKIKQNRFGACFELKKIKKRWILT